MRYVGEFKDGEKHGQGTMMFNSTGSNMRENSRMGKLMVKEHSLHLMEQSMKENLMKI